MSTRKANHLQAGSYATALFCALLFAGPLSAATAFKADKLAAIDSAVATAIAEKKLPGGVLWLEQNGSVHKKVYGNRALVPAEEPTTEAPEPTPDDESPPAPTAT